MSSLSRIQEQRVNGLINEFDRYVELYDREVPFRRAGQFEYHKATITSRRSAPNIAAAIGSEFTESLWNTLRAWGIGVRSSRLVGVETFRTELARWTEPLASLEELKLADSNDATRDKVWQLIQEIDIVDNKARLVALTKTLHHLLPDLVVPIDRAYTGAFFGWQPAQFQFDQRKIFEIAWAAFKSVAQATDPERFVGDRWRTSSTKIIDNAVVGFCIEEGLLKAKVPALQRQDRRPPRRPHWTITDLRTDLAVFEDELGEAGLKEQSIQTYVGRSKTFVDWLEGRYQPRGPNA